MDAQLTSSHLPSHTTHLVHVAIQLAAVLYRLIAGGVVQLGSLGISAAMALWLLGGSTCCPQHRPVLNSPACRA